MCWGFSNNCAHIECHECDPWEGDLVTYQVWMFLQLLKSDFRKRGQNDLIMDLVERHLPETGEMSSAEHTVTAGSQSTTADFKYCFSEKLLFIPPIQAAFPGGARLPRKWIWQKPKRILRWGESIKRGKLEIDAPIWNLGQDRGHGCVCSKVLYAWE